MAPAADLFVIRAAQDIDDVVEPHSEPAVFANTIDAREQFLGGFGAVEGFLGLKAIVAGTAVFFLELFTEIIEQHALAALATLGVVHHFLE